MDGATARILLRTKHATNKGKPAVNRCRTFFIILPVLIALVRLAAASVTHHYLQTLGFGCSPSAASSGTTTN
jgi:hypothetical protein